MKETKFLGALLPSHPDFEPIIRAIREKYNLHEVYPKDDPIEEIYLGDRAVSLDEFNQDIKNQILENLEIVFPETYVKKYKSAKQAIGADYKRELEKFSDELKPALKLLFDTAKNTAEMTYKTLDAQIDQLTHMICTNLLLGDTLDAPQEWFGNVMTISTGDETIIIAMANEITNLDWMFQQIQELHRKTFRTKHTRITKTIADTSYFLQLAKRNKDKDFILDEFIRLNKLSLPRDRNSTRYAQVRYKYAQRLRKRLKSAKLILDAIGGEEK